VDTSNRGHGAPFTSIVPLFAPEVAHHQSAAEADITRALSLNASDSEVLYHAAVVRTLNGDVERALTLLEQALKNGYSSAIARRDRDLDGIRQLTRFHQMVGSPQ
jgi:hypothetical protein